MKICLLLALIVGVCIAQQVTNEYYTSFVGTLEIDASVSLECNDEIREVLSVARVTLERDYRDVDVLIDGVIEFVDKLKYEITPTCRSFYGDFDGLMEEFDGDNEALREDIESNLDLDHSQISREILCGLIALKLSDEYDAGKLHANVYRRLLGLPIHDLVISPLVLEEEKRYNEEIRSDRPLRGGSSSQRSQEPSDYTTEDETSDDEDTNSSYDDNYSQDDGTNDSTYDDNTQSYDSNSGDDDTWRQDQDIDDEEFERNGNARVLMEDL